MYVSFLDQWRGQKFKPECRDQNMHKVKEDHWIISSDPVGSLTFTS